MTTSLQEWLSPQSVAYLSECLQICETSKMLADLRAIAPPEALRQASQRLSPRKRQQIRVWVQQLNAEMGVAA
jgi:uncharacterized membrane protein